MNKSLIYGSLKIGESFEIDMKTIHTTSGSQLIYEKVGKDRKMHDSKEQEEQMPLPKALQDAPKEYIKGYRALSIHEIEAINFIKYMGIEIGKMCDRVDQMHDIDKRWLAIGKTNLQQGLMAVIRAIAKPETF
jgi:hypothetical protein